MPGSFTSRGRDLHLISTLTFQELRHFVLFAPDTSAQPRYSAIIDVANYFCHHLAFRLSKMRKKCFIFIHSPFLLFDAISAPLQPPDGHFNDAGYVVIVIVFVFVFVIVIVIVVISMVVSFVISIFVMLDCQVGD